MTGSLFDRPIAPPGKGQWIRGVLTSPPGPAEKQPAMVAGGSGGSGCIDLRKPCPRCKAEPFVHCHEVPGDVRFSMGHRERV